MTRLKSKKISNGVEIKKYEVISSTQTIAKKIKNHHPWLVILAKEQTAGYGRKKVSWFSPRGGLYFSVILPKSKIEDLQTLTILAAFIVAKIIKKDFNLEPLINLPNDVLISGKKVCGILTENVIGTSASSVPTLNKIERVGDDIKFSVMGIGLNTNITNFPKDLENITTSLKIELGKEVNNEKVLKQIVKELIKQLKTISE